MNYLTFRIIEWGSSDWMNAVKLRERILRKPLGSIFSVEELDDEKNHIQVAGFIEGELLATALLVVEELEIKMQRVVVKEDFQNQLIGSQMMIYCENIAEKIGVKNIYCHARDSAINFYLINDYQKCGDYFDEDGIPHLKMIKKLRIET